MRLQPLLYAAFAIALVGGGTMWFLNNFELQTLEEYTGYKGEARHNPLFAARLFSKRMGIPAERHDGLVNLPETDTVIVLNTERFSLSAEKVDELLDWVSRGGHLITRARVDVESEAELEAEDFAETEDRDLLQTRLGIDIGEHQIPDEDELPIQVQLANSSESVAVEPDFFNSLHSETDDARHYRLDGQSWLIQQPYGNGLVSMAATLEMIENSALDTAEHGRFFWYLLHSHNPDFKQVWLIHQDTLPHLFILLFRHAGPLLAVLALLILFSFWAFMPRFGALIPEPAPQRRRIMDHITASGQFLWKKQQRGPEQLCSALQHSVQQYSQRRIPGWQLMSQAEQQTALATLLGWPERDLKPLQQLLTADRLNESGFIRLTQLAHRLRNHA
ncbi:MAG: hypothetical protein CSA79_02390 [Thiothrix nivea]|nr:MAG: hypothetical protein CSA79_02390 [Thiothrix nivea]